MRRLGVETLAEAGGSVGEKVGRAREGESAGGVGEIDEDGADALEVEAGFEGVRAADDGERVLNLPARLAAVARARVRRAGDERAGAVDGVVGRDGIVDVDEDDGARRAAAGFERGRESRDLRAELVDGARGDDEVVCVGEGVRVARAALQGGG